MPKPLLQVTPNTAAPLPPCCLSLKGQIQPFFHRQKTKGLKDATFRKRHSSLFCSHCVFSPPGAVVIVSGWGKQFLQRFPDTLMEVKFNLCPTESDTSALPGTFLLHVSP